MSPALLILGLGLDANAGDLSFNYTPTPAPDEQPAFMVTPSLPLSRLVVEVEAGGQLYTFEENDLPAGQVARFAWDRDPSVTAASVYVLGEFAAGHTEQVQIPIAVHIKSHQAGSIVGIVKTSTGKSASHRPDISAFGISLNSLATEDSPAHPMGTCDHSMV